MKIKLPFLRSDTEERRQDSLSGIDQTSDLPISRLQNRTDHHKARVLLLASGRSGRIQRSLQTLGWQSLGTQTEKGTGRAPLVRSRQGASGPIIHLIRCDRWRPYFGL